MNVYAIFDSLPSARLISRLVVDPRLIVAIADVRSSAIMGACGTIVRELTPTILVLDSDSLEDRAIMEERADVGAILASCEKRVPYRLILAVPQVEAILFSERDGFEQALGWKVTEQDWFEARFRPRAVFRRLLGEGDYAQSAMAVIDRLDESALRRMRRHPVVREIAEFIPQVQKPGAWGVCVRRAG
jgi:hypothetical protein